MEEEKGVPVRAQTGGAKRPPSIKDLVKTMVIKEINEMRPDLTQKEFVSDFKVF